MSKQITSPSTRWPGTVMIADPLTIPQAQLIEAGLKQPDAKEGERVWLSIIDAGKLPAILGCVEKWELENFTPDPFPASPRGDSHKLIDWLFSELLKVYFGEAIVPNE
jgi:hypothetical protein